MEIFASSLLLVVQVVMALLAAPLLVGWIRMLKCWTHGRCSAGPLQPFRDILKLFSKETVVAENASFIFRFTPYLVFASTLAAGMLIPTIAADLPFEAAADVIVLVAIFALARFFIALAGMDIGSSFGGMGASREMTISSLAEPVMLMSVFTVSLVGKSTSLSHIVNATLQSGVLLRPSLTFALLAFILITIAETGRVPVDNPSTHLELTMIHEAMILEYSGRHLALIEWAQMMKLFLLSSMGIAFFFPWGMAIHGSSVEIALSLVFFSAKLAVIGVAIVLIETGLAKMRIFRVPDYLGGAFISAVIGMISFFMLE